MSNLADEVSEIAADLPEMWTGRYRQTLVTAAIHIRAAEDEITFLRNRLALIASIIEAADNRALAADGPVGHVRNELTATEWRDIYLAAKGDSR